MNAIEIRGLKKSFPYRGKNFWALKGIDLSIRKGRVFGLLGPNGAGKTTLIFILSTLLTPTSGTASVLGLDVNRDSKEIKKRIGVCFGGTNFFWDFNAREILTYYGRLNGLSKQKTEKNMNHLIKCLGITSYQYKPFTSLSTGMRQKVAVAKSLLNDPEVLFLDEPTAGLDVEVALDVRNFILDLIKERGMTALLTSHQMGEIEHMCKRIAIINKGKLLTTGKINEIKSKLVIHDVIRIYLDDYQNLNFLKKISGVIHYGVSDGLYITVDSAKDRISGVLTAFKKRERAIKDLEIRKLSLEEVFLTIVGKKTTLPIKIRGEKDV